MNRIHFNTLFLEAYKLMKAYMVADEMTILFIEIIDKFPYKTDRLLKLEIHSEILKTVPN